MNGKKKEKLVVKKKGENVKMWKCKNAKNTKNGKKSKKIHEG